METKVTLLYVDDEPINVMLFQQMFKKKYTVYTAISGLQGLEILQGTPGINVIISDMKMPGMNGIEFIKKAKELYPEMVYFILTGFEITPEIQQSLEAGVISKYFQKPFDMKKIDAAISEKLDIR